MRLRFTRVLPCGPVTDFFELVATGPRNVAFSTLRVLPLGPTLEVLRVRTRPVCCTLVALEEIWLDGGQRDRIGVSDLSDSLYHFYRHELGLVIAAVEDRVGVGVMPDWTPDAFHLRPGQTAGYVERVGRTADQRPAEFSRTWFDGTRAVYISRMGKG